ncbi:MAG TPA: DUF3800 domain-containing protein [Planctomycetaceae bacterium]|nr:DUF3800 domain-containing protein [Planctomycetaceae bacterium]
MFVDESGDPGRKTASGSSPFFVVTTVVFQDRNVAQDCDDGIVKLRSELKLPRHKEFHFNSDNDRIRQAFLNCVAPFPFFYSSVVLNKEALTGPGFRYKESLYKYTVKLAFSNILEYLDNATVVFDECGGREFVRELKTYLRREMREEEKIRNKPASPGRRIKKIRAQGSHTNNLLQLADNVCGAVNRCYASKAKGRTTYRNIVRKREVRIQIWPQLGK